jgi:PBP1b-binding outer membrane lipoprotein LpoB
MGHTSSPVFALLFVVALLPGCAHSALSSKDKRLDEKLAAETSIKTRADVSQAAKAHIDHAQGLTPDQRSRLLALHSATKQKMDDISIRSLRLRAVLLQDLMSEENSADEVELIKSRFRDVEAERTATLFDAAEQASHILGKEASRNRHVFTDLFERTHGPLD